MNSTTVELERKIAILSRLSDISLALNSTQKVKTLLTLIMEAAAEIVEAEAASVLLWDSKHDELRFAATTTDEVGENLIGKPVPLDGSIAGTVLRENRTVIVNDVSDDPRHYHGIDEQNQFVTRSILGVPMVAKSRVIGVLEAINKRDLPWTPDDENYLMILAAQAAVAMESAQLVSALQRANEELSQVDRLKSSFIAIASHELRTPLGVILGYASFLQETTDPEVRQHAEKVVNSALQLRGIIEDLVNLRYMEQNTADLKREAVNLHEFLNEVIHDFLTLAEAKQHRLQYIAPPANVRVHIDRARVTMALSNVINNAVRFTPEGGRIVIRADQHSPREAWVTVTDSGIGIPRDQLEHIFERFRQVEDHMTRHHGGLGIGLSIARAVLEAHGGRIWATSPGAGQGATFTLAMPISS